MNFPSCKLYLNKTWQINGTNLKGEKIQFWDTGFLRTFPLFDASLPTFALSFQKTFLLLSYLPSPKVVLSALPRFHIAAKSLHINFYAASALTRPVPSICTFWDGHSLSGLSSGMLGLHSSLHSSTQSPPDSGPERSSSWIFWCLFTSKFTWKLGLIDLLSLTL